jgi:GTP1/Obg family GTP-binding protein
MPVVGHFQLGGDQISIIVDANNIMFSDTSTGTTTTIHGLKLSKAGVIKEHPDLKDDDEWRKKAIDRLKKHIKKFKTEIQKINYIKDELVKFGYTPLFFQRAGHRPQKF